MEMFTIVPYLAHAALDKPEVYVIAELLRQVEQYLTSVPA
jgi:hypothetical protein